MPIPCIEKSVRLAGCLAVVAVIVTLAIPVDEMTHETVDDATFATTEAGATPSPAIDATRCVGAADGTLPTIDGVPPLFARGPRCDDGEPLHAAALAR